MEYSEDNDYVTLRDVSGGAGTYSMQLFLDQAVPDVATKSYLASSAEAHLRKVRRDITLRFNEKRYKVTISTTQQR